MSERPSFFAELKRCNVYNVAVACLAGAWLVIQAASIFLPTLISQNAISKPRRGGRTRLPRVFIEHGALMAASILNSDRAIAMSVYVIRAFVEMHEQLAANAAILKRFAEIDKTLVLHGTALSDIYEKLLTLLSPQPDPPPRQIVFIQ